jgi:outer membrane protein OmpA-like peptidoglycan-associated protein
MRKLLFAAMFLLAACSKQSAPAAPALAPVLKSVYFETGSSTIRPADMPVIAAAAKTLNKSDWWVIVLGMTDATGDFQSNQKLSMQRAEAVAAALRKQAPVTPPARIKAYALGEQLATGGKTVAERKVEFVFYQQSDASIEQVIIDSRVLTDDFRKAAAAQ